MLGERKADCDRPARAADRTPEHAPPVEGAIGITVAQINYRYGPADWFPTDHPPMPDIVAHGKEATAPARRNLSSPNGKG